MCARCLTAWSCNSKKKEESSSDRGNNLFKENSLERTRPRPGEEHHNQSWAKSNSSPGNDLRRPVYGSTAMGSNKLVSFPCNVYMDLVIFI